jgi:hypothetical protein
VPIETFTRLTRQTQWTRQVVCGFIIGLLAAAGVGLIYMTYFHERDHGEWPMYAFGAVWIAVGLFVILGSVHQAFATRSPETIVEISPAVLVPGRALIVRIIQPGPLRLRSLHANLTGEKTIWKWVTGGHRRSFVSWQGPYRILEIGREDIEEHAPLQREATSPVPAGIEPTIEQGDTTIVWKIEVWGACAGGQTSCTRSS